MKRYYNDRTYVGDPASLDAELLGGNDRSAIITVASLAESHLEALIGLSLPHLRFGTEQDWDLTFRHEGPLGAFSACINMAYYLTLIDENLRDQLHDLRHMRNAVAHTKRRVTFDDTAIQNVAKRLFAPKGLFKAMDDTPDGIRRTFIAEGLIISSTLIYGREVALDRSRKSFIKAGKTVPF